MGFCDFLLGTVLLSVSGRKWRTVRLGEERWEGGKWSWQR